MESTHKLIFPAELNMFVSYKTELNISLMEKKNSLLSVFCIRILFNVHLYQIINLSSSVKNYYKNPKKMKDNLTKLILSYMKLWNIFCT